MKVVRLLAPSLCALALLAGSQASAFEPKNVECIAPANPGGGWDFTCRQVGKTLYDLKLVPSPVKVTNMPGGGGGVAYTYTVSKRSDDPNLLVAASTATTTRLAQNQYAGMTADQVRWVASLGADFGVIAVGKDSPHKDLKSLLSAMKADPSKVAFGGGSAVGGWDHLKVLLVAKEAGIEDAKSVKYVSFNSGGDALTQLLGGHVQAFTGDITEVKGQLDAGNIRVLAVLSPERLPTDPDLPTAKEQGYDVVGANWRGFYVPKGVSDETFQGWGNAMEKLYNSEEWQKAMKANGLAPFWNGGPEFDTFVNDQI
ncbi:MAG TPA: tripartite tricarboxylate transporter substrate binding protein, partial [Kiloniellales bacterium]|nr:tripartite tricarboxylate transporter substrate binding protein [Kiloniellales bacterium]